MLPPDDIDDIINAINKQNSGAFIPYQMTKMLL